MSFAPGFGTSPEIFFPQSDSDGTPVCVPDEDFFFYLLPMPAYIGALSVLVGIGGGPQFPQTFEYDPWQAPIIQQTQNVVALPPDQADWAHGVFEDDGYLPRIVWTDANMLRIVWDDGDLPITTAPVVPDDSVAPAAVRWPESTTIINQWSLGGGEDLPALPIAEETEWLSRIVWPSWTPTAVVYDDAYIGQAIVPLVEETEWLPRIVWESWSPTQVVYDDAQIVFPLREESEWIPRIQWPNWTPIQVVYDDAQIPTPAIPLLVEWQEWQRPIIWPELPPMVTLQPWLWDSADMFNPFSLHAGLRVTDLGNDSYIVTDASGNRYLVREWGLSRYGVEDA